MQLEFTRQSLSLACVCVCVCVCWCVCACACVHVCVWGCTITQKDIDLETSNFNTLKYNYENNSRSIWSEQAKGQRGTLKFFSIYRNTNCQVPQLNLWYIKHVYLSDYTKFMNIITLE